MKKLLLTLISICFLLPGICFGQIDPSASKVADKYLNGIKIIDLPEGKKMLSDLIWENPSLEYPVFTEVSTLFEGMFITDTPGIQGYRRLVDLKAASQAGLPLIKRYILISYKDAKFKKWKVFTFRKSIDIEDEIQECLRDLNDTKTIFPLYKRYGSYGYWLLAGGKFIKSKDAFQKASELNRQDPDEYTRLWNQNIYNNYLIIIRRITEK